MRSGGSASLLSSGAAMLVGYMVAVVVVARCAGASINCRVACRECRDAREPRDLLTVYCAMCEECKDRRREREWLIARKQDLEKEADYLRKPDLSKVQRTNSNNAHECPPTCIEPRVPTCVPCPAPTTTTTTPPMEMDSIPYGCPTPPPCEDETTQRPTCPAIPQCIRKRPTLPAMPYYQPAYQNQVPQQQPMYQTPPPQQETPQAMYQQQLQGGAPMQPQMSMMPQMSCVPCVNTCPCPQETKAPSESVIIGVPEKML